MATFKLNEKFNGVEITFNAKPGTETRTSLKEAGFRWNPKTSVWYTRKTDDAIAFAKVICESKETVDTPGTESVPVNQYGVKVGDLFVDVFGYDATIHTFYQVVGLKGKTTVLLKRVNAVSKQTGFNSWDTMPKRDSFVDEKPIIKRTKLGYDGKSVYAGEFYAGEWDRWYENDDYH